MASRKENVDLDKDVFTTFDAADICNANVTSIKNWIEQGELEAHRTPGGHYRIQKESLEAFLNRHEMPNPFAERERKRILALHRDSQITERLEEQFGTEHTYESLDDLVWSLLKIGVWQPDVVIIDDRITAGETEAICEGIDTIVALRPVQIVVLHEAGAASSKGLEGAGADYVVDVDRGEDEFLEAVRRVLM